MKILCVIPSRIGSTRLPRKPLLSIQGKPMIQWVYENAKRCTALTEVVVATDNEDIAGIIKSCHGKVVMTAPELPTGSDRVAAVAEAYPDMDVIINLQGDEPFIKPRMLTALVSPYLNGETPDMTTLAFALAPGEQDNPNIVKVITDRDGYAIYFSRSPLPYFRVDTPVPSYHHMGLYAFKRDFLLHYTTLKQTPLEKAESLEQLRALEHGHRIRVCVTEDRTLEVNNAEELAQAQAFCYSED